MSKCFEKFSRGNFGLSDEPRSARRLNLMKTLVDSNTTVTVEELVEQLNSTHSFNTQVFTKVGKGQQAGRMDSL